MVFSSIVFLSFFLPATLILYYSVQSVQLKNVVLLICSIVFYAWGEPVFVLLMMTSILVNYSSGLLIHQQKIKGGKGALPLVIAIFLNLSLLVYFKYFNFLVDSINHILDCSINAKEVLLPIGISFFTFQGMSYVIDVYREDPNDESKYIVQKSFIRLALYISMFPQLIAGPIVRYNHIQPYLSDRRHSFKQVADGIEIFIIGLAKKVLIANVLGATANNIMDGSIDMISMPVAWLGAICYSFQLFFDFAGYSEMAIGLGKMFGFEFDINFNYPYISTSISEFWRRWHMSLSQWFRDYLYIPLGGSRTGNVYFNLFVVFLATGIWHGAAYGFVIWGLWHGLFVIIEKFYRNHGFTFLSHIPKVFGWLYTMMVVLIGWVLFRIVDLGKTIHYYKIMLGISVPEFSRFDLSWYLNNRTVFILVIAILCCIPWKSILKNKFSSFDSLISSRWFVTGKRVFLLVLLVLSYMYIANSNFNPFIYFRF